MISMISMTSTVYVQCMCGAAVITVSLYRSFLTFYFKRLYFLLCRFLPLRLYAYDFSSSSLHFFCLSSLQFHNFTFYISRDRSHISLLSLYMMCKCVSQFNLHSSSSGALQCNDSNVPSTPNACWSVCCVMWQVDGRCATLVWRIICRVIISRDIISHDTCY